MTNYDELSDVDLLSRLKQSNRNNLIGEIYQRYSHLILGTCLYYLKDGAVAQDATMDIFEKLVENLHKYQIENLKSWLLQVTKNHCLKQLTRVIKKEKKVINKNIDANSVEITQEEDHSNEEILIDLEKALDTLKEHQQKCIVLFYLRGMSYEEISSETKYEIKQVKSYIQNGKRNLSKQLHRYNEKEG